MNFDTKYLIRWGIPGWLMVMCLFPYFIIINFSYLAKHVSNATDLLAVGAALTVLGVPLGYLLNQLHHSLFWVLPKWWKRKWVEYFKEEIQMDEYFDGDEKREKKRERYRYLLSRKHELGGIVVSLGISASIILIHCIYLIIGNHHIKKWEVIYFIVVLILLLIMWLSRNYSSKNVKEYQEYYITQSRNNGSP
ncbi:hypothetical protein ACQRXC_03870 [Niallia taxi]|uniref:hypothetical protein n=1 Tax=Niallia taxi TaxID=2499688 RepID=UPI003F61D742